MIPVFKFDNRIFYIKDHFDIRYTEESETDEVYDIPEVNTSNVICKIICKYSDSENTNIYNIIFENDDYYVTCMPYTYKQHLRDRESDKYIFYSFPKHIKYPYRDLSYHIDYTNKNLNLIDNL